MDSRNFVETSAWCEVPTKSDTYAKDKLGFSFKLGKELESGYDEKEADAFLKRLADTLLERYAEYLQKHGSEIVTDMVDAEVKKRENEKISELEGKLKKAAEEYIKLQKKVDGQDKS